MTPREIALKVAWSHLNGPYLWAGDNPLAGFDCSGFAIECLKSAGILPRSGDWTANGLYEKFKVVHIPYEGCLVFWENNGRIIHVEICLDDIFAIGFSGGGSDTLTVQDAIRSNAYCKCRPFRSRAGLYGFVDPFLSMS
uniref:NlpC/P60 domain-containing protein n=1 Tax=viral metagenome TaxID=1070528 RepID=A0A6M3JF58_9ZZZZ